MAVERLSKVCWCRAEFWAVVRPIMKNTAATATSAKLNVAFMGSSSWKSKLLGPPNHQDVPGRGPALPVMRPMLELASSTDAPFPPDAFPLHGVCMSRQLGSATSRAGARCRQSKPAHKRPAGATQRKVASHAPSSATLDPTAHAMARVLAITNQKGGVGKTTTAINLAASLAAAEVKTLLIDCDPQANATSGLGYTPAEFGAAGRASLYQILRGEASAAEAIVPTPMEGLDLLPSSRDLAGLNLE